jgi:hypothetical protein
MAAALTKIQGLQNCQPLFREFCKINGLNDGDLFKATDYMRWVESLNLIQQLEIIRKYKPGFKLRNCNL